MSPILMAQGRLMRRMTLRLPEAKGERLGLIQVEGGGPALKLLFVGDSTMAGVGVQYQTSGLGYETASRVAKKLARSVRWQVIAKSGVGTGQALALVRSQLQVVPDVLITALGVNDVLSQTKPSDFIHAYKELLSGVAWQSGARLAVLSGVPPLHIIPAAPQPLRWYLGKYAKRLDRTLEHWVLTQPRVSHSSLQWADDCTMLAVDGFHPGERLYRAWADQIAGVIAKSSLNKSDER